MNPETNEISAVCKVCYSDQYGDQHGHSKWAKVEPLKEGDVSRGTYMHAGGGTELSENYGCDLNAKGERQCKGDSFIASAKSEESKKEIRFSCTSKARLKRSDLNEIFKGTFQFNKGTFDEE